MSDTRRGEVLLIPGLNGSGPDHWQSHWEWSRGDTRRVEQVNWHDPEPEDWISTIDAAVSAATGPVVLVAHSLGCAAVAHWAAGGTTSQVGAALLVAPCDVERIGIPAAIARFAPMPRAALPFRSIVVASSNDPYCTLTRARCFAEHWGSSLAEAGALGHVNATSRLANWPFGQALLDDLLTTGDVAHHLRAAALRDAAPWPCNGIRADEPR